MLKRLMTQTVSTKRTPAISGGKVGDPVTNLTNVKVTPLMFGNDSGSQMVRQLTGLDGSATQLWQAFTTVHAHTDSGTPVTQLPDIRNGDRVVIGSESYTVKWTEAQPATTSYDATLTLYLTEDKRS